MAEGTKTAIDSMIDFLSVNGKQELNDVATSLKINPSVIEDWAKMLEEDGLLKISYEFGKMYLSIPQVSQSEASMLKSKFNFQQEALGSELESEIIEIQRLATTLENLKSTTLKANRIYSEKLPDLENKLNEINKIYLQIDKENKLVLDIKDNLEKTYSGIEKKILDLMEKVKYFDSGEFENKLAETLTKLKGNIEDSKKSEETIQNMQKEKDKELSDIRSNIEKEMKSIIEDTNNKSKEIIENIKKREDEIKGYTKELNEQIKTSHEVFDSVNEFNKTKEKDKKILNDIIKDFSNDYSKKYSIISKGSETLNSHANEIMKNILQIKDGFGEASKIYDSLSYITKDLEKISASTESVKNEIQEMKRSFNLLKAAKDKSITEKSEIINDLSKKADQTEKAILNIKDNLQDDVEILSRRKGIPEKNTEDAEADNKTNINITKKKKNKKDKK